jgi:hypothetical protein
MEIIKPRRGERRLRQAALGLFLRDWNTKDESSGFAGYVLRFNVPNEFLNSYEIHVVGDSVHREYWIPAAELANFNANIVGSIEVVSEFRRPE